MEVYEKGKNKKFTLSVMYKPVRLSNLNEKNNMFYTTIKSYQLPKFL